MATSTLKLVHDQHAELMGLCEELGLPVQLVMDFSAALLDGFLEKQIPKDQKLLGECQPVVRGSRWGCETRGVSIDAKLGKRVSNWAKVLQCSTTLLLHHWMDEMIENLKRLRAPNRHSIGGPINNLLSKLEANPYKRTIRLGVPD